MRERIKELAGLLGVSGTLKFQRFSVEPGTYEKEPTRTVAGMQHLGIGPVRVPPVYLLLLISAAIIEGRTMLSPVLILHDPDNLSTLENRELLKSGVAPLIRDATVALVEQGTGRAARIEGRNIGGKTSTVGGKSNTASLLGLDFDNYIVAVVLLKTKGYGGEVAGPEVRKLFLLAQ